MARRPRAASIETRTARLKLPVRGKPYAFVSISPGVSLAYRRNRKAGVWVVRVADGRGGAWNKNVAYADDREDSNGDTIVSFFEAVDKARALARGGDVEGSRPATVSEALDDYARDLAARDGAFANARNARRWLTPVL